MTGGLYRGDPLTPEERGEFEDDLIGFSDRELDFLGEIRDLDVLYAGGSSLLWVEGLARRVGAGGSVTALDLNAGRVAATTDDLGGADLPAPVRLVVGDVFDPPFAPRSFDLVYSAGLFHELDVGERGAADALRALASTVRPGGRVATGDFVDAVPAVQLEDEALDAERAREVSGGHLFGVGPPERLVRLHREVLGDVRWRLSPPRPVRHLDKLVLAEETPVRVLRERIAREGYTRPATVYVAGRVRGG